MPHEITVPRLGWSMEEGVFVEWLKRDGEPVEVGDPLFALEGEKAIQEIESLERGVLRIPANGPKDGETVRVGAVVGYLVAAGEVVPAAPGREAGREVQTAAAPPASPSVRRLAREMQVDLASFPAGTRVTEEDVRRASASQAAPPVAPSPEATPPRRRNGLPPISPRAARVAAELGVDWSKLIGSGRGGRIRERDVRAASKRVTTSSTAGAASIRRTIADRLRHSFQQTVPVTLTARADATNLVGLWEQFKASRSGNVVPTYTDIIAKVAAGALSQHPEMNVRWDGDKLASPDGIHIGIAVDTEAGLLVPVIAGADQLSLLEFARVSRDRVARARERRLAVHEMQGGTFTITNLGGFGVELFTPVINWPEIAILGVGAIRKQPVVVADDRIEARWQLPLSLTFDHRAIDGAPAARFLQTLRERLENPAAWLISD
jgi:pyruvate dehydrogenase E2 component (dihydrolipoamide acetyltransferase)